MAGSMGEPGTALARGPDEEDYFSIMQVMGGSGASRVLRATIKLGLLDVISQGAKPMSAVEIVAHIPARNPEAAVMVDRMLGLLASYGVVTCTLHKLPSGKTERLYGLSAAGKFLIKNEDGMSLAPMISLIWENAFVQSWNHLEDAVLEGGLPFSRAHDGKTPFEYMMTRDPKFREVFHRGMSEFSFITSKKILETYDGFDGLGSVVDIGGGTGAMMNMIVTKYPTIKGINFDLPHVISRAPPYPGVEHVGGDMFVSVPKLGDAIFIKWIAHNWGDEQFMKLLKNCYEALPENGKVILAEYTIPQLPDSGIGSKTAFQFDCLMMVQFPGGKERTVEEFQDLAKKGGFEGFRYTCKVYSFAIMELLKKA